jgi:hypothetical protein
MSELKKVVFKINDLFSRDEAQTVRLKCFKKQPWRTFYSTFVPKSKRRLAEKQANSLQKQHVAKLWKIFLDKYFSGELNSFQLKPKKHFADQKIIWQYWGQGLAAAQQIEVVNLCFASVDQYKGDYQVIRLDEESVREYLDFPEFVWNKKKNKQFKPAFFADLIRLALLDVYGGIWIDATILLTENIDDRFLSQDFFMFHRDNHVTDKPQWVNFNNDYFGWGENHNVNVLNSFIISKKNNKFVHACFEIMMNYWETQKDIPHYFIFQIMFNELLKYKDYEDQMIVVDDTLPHLLQIRLNDKFDINEYNLILRKTNIHKLTYIKEPEEGTFFSYIKSLF